MFRRLNGWHFGLSFGIWFLTVMFCWADDFDEEPFEVRLWSAMSRSVSSTDAIGRQASVAYPSGSSDNPAGVDVRDFEILNTKGYLSAGTHHVFFNDGAWIAAEDVNGFIHLNNAGTLSLGYIHMSMPEGQTRQGFNDDFHNNEVLLKYGWNIKKGFFGIGFRLRDMKLDYDDLYKGFPRSTQNDSTGGTLTIGGLWRPNSDLNVGILIDAGWIESDIKSLVYLPGPVNAPFALDLTTETINVKTGIRWRKSQALAVYADGQYFRLDNRFSTVDIGRFYFGGDIRLAQRISLMVGGSIDTEAQASVSTGVCINMSIPRLIKVTYQYNPLPEISYEFGTGHLISATVVFGF